MVILAVLNGLFYWGKLQMRFMLVSGKKTEVTKRIPNSYDK